MLRQSVTIIVITKNLYMSTIRDPEVTTAKHQQFLLEDIELSLKPLDSFLPFPGVRTLSGRVVPRILVPYSV